MSCRWGLLFYTLFIFDFSFHPDRRIRVFDCLSVRTKILPHCLWQLWVSLYVSKVKNFRLELELEIDHSSFSLKLFVCALSVSVDTIFRDLLSPGIS